MRNKPFEILRQPVNKDLIRIKRREIQSPLSRFHKISKLKEFPPLHLVQWRSQQLLEVNIKHTLKV